MTVPLVGMVIFGLITGIGTAFLDHRISGGIKMPLNVIYDPEMQ